MDIRDARDSRSDPARESQDYGDLPPPSEILRRNRIQPARRKSQSFGELACHSGVRGPAAAGEHQPSGAPPPPPGIPGGNEIPPARGKPPSFVDGASLAGPRGP